MSIDHRSLGSRFDRALVDAGATRAGASSFEALALRYGEPHRHYHTLEHVAACLDWLDRCEGLAHRPAEVELALWFHDVVYDPKADDNERQSARWACEVLGALGVADGVTQRIAENVEATQDHSATGGDGALVVDLDLTILGASEHAFDRFDEQIRAEYAHVPNELYRRGRRRVLERFLAKAQIYRTPRLRDELEVRARANLERGINALQRD